MQLTVAFLDLNPSSICYTRSSSAIIFFPTVLSSPIYYFYRAFLPTACNGFPFLHLYLHTIIFLSSICLVTEIIKQFLLLKNSSFFWCSWLHAGSTNHSETHRPRAFHSSPRAQKEMYLQVRDYNNI